MKIEIIGTGSAFDCDETNTSFLLSVKGEKVHNILFDCGYNVVSELCRMKNGESVIKNLDAVYISHEDDDHIGSLKTLMYKRFYVYGKQTKVISHGNSLKWAESVNTEEKICIPISIFEDSLKDYCKEVSDSFEIIPLKGEHHVPNYGAIFLMKGDEDHDSEMIVLTGDTLAIPSIEENVMKIADKHNVKEENVIIFHDYSLWDSPENTVHAHHSNIKEVYSQNFRNRLIYVHYKGIGIQHKIFHAPVKGKEKNF
jgi:ribonuclease BN (tRNA processing enzyme)